MKILTVLLVLGAVVIFAYLMVEVVFYLTSRKQPRKEYGCAVRKEEK